MPSPQWISDQIGALGDTLALVLGGEKVLTAESWEHTEGILSQPCSWNLRLGWGGVAADILKKYPKNTAFELYAAGQKQATGHTDGNEASQSGSSATEITVRGRDEMKRLHDSYVKAQVGVNVATYADLVRFAFKQVGLDQRLLQVDNNANRQIKTGVPLTAILPHRTVEQILEDAGIGGPNAGAVHTTPLAKLGETWLGFLRRYLDRAGLFLWAAADGTFVLSAPNGSQSPIYQLRRVAPSAQSSNVGANVVGMRFSDLATHRHTEAIVYGRGGGKKLGRVKSKGGFQDDEMMAFGYVNQPIVFRDVNVHSPAEASYFAHRKLAEERRGGWVLEYTVAGLTLPVYGGSGIERAVLTPDTVVQVDDDELDIHGPHYIETVIRKRSPATTTTIRLMRVEDLVFGGVQE